MGVSRNAPCPCGSGRKYKRCCLGKLDAKTRRRLLITVSVALATVVAMAGAVGFYTTPSNGIIAGVAGAAGIGIFLAVRNPPRSRGRQGADRIDFGR